MEAADSFKQLNRDIYATVWPISTKFGAVARLGISDRTRP